MTNFPFLSALKEQITDRQRNDDYKIDRIILWSMIHLTLHTPAFAARYSGYGILKKGACTSSQHQELEHKFHEQEQPLDPIHNHQS
jgi:hypothetical protein